MGTNFYLLSDDDYDSMDPEYHIGKRSAAGWYCWDCKTTLTKGGIKNVHHGIGQYNRCPVCGKRPAKEPIEESSAGRELGFNKSTPKKKTGVKSCASFTWAMPRNRLDKLNSRKKEIIDEYGRRYNIGEFQKILEECPIQFFNFGEWFC